MPIVIVPLFVRAEFWTRIEDTRVEVESWIDTNVMTFASHIVSLSSLSTTAGLFS